MVLIDSRTSTSALTLSGSNYAAGPLRGLGGKLRQNPGPPLSVRTLALFRGGSCAVTTVTLLQFPFVCWPSSAAGSGTGSAALLQHAAAGAASRVSCSTIQNYPPQRCPPCSPVPRPDPAQPSAACLCCSTAGEASSPLPQPHHTPPSNIDHRCRHGTRLSLLSLLPVAVFRPVPRYSTTQDPDLACLRPPT